MLARARAPPMGPAALAAAVKLRGEKGGELVIDSTATQRSPERADNRQKPCATSDAARRKASPWGRWSDRASAPSPSQSRAAWPPRARGRAQTRTRPPCRSKRQSPYSPLSVFRLFCSASARYRIKPRARRIMPPTGSTQCPTTSAKSKTELMTPKVSAKSQIATSRCVHPRLVRKAIIVGGPSRD